MLNYGIPVAHKVFKCANCCELFKHILRISILIYTVCITFVGAVYTNAKQQKYHLTSFRFQVLTFLKRKMVQSEGGAKCLKIYSIYRSMETGMLKKSRIFKKNCFDHIGV